MEVLVKLPHNPPRSLASLLVKVTVTVSVILWIGGLITVLILHAIKEPGNSALNEPVIVNTPNTSLPVQTETPTPQVSPPLPNTPSPTPPTAVKPPLPWYQEVTKLKDLVTALGIFIGGLFAYYKFVKGRVFKSRLELKVSGKIITQGARRILIASAQIKNKGLTQVYLDNTTTCILLYRSARLTSPRKERQPAWGKPVSYPRVFVNHGWVEPDETIYDQILIELLQEEDIAYKLELFVRSRRPLFKDRLKSWRQRRALGGEWSSNSIAEEKLDEEESGTENEGPAKP